MIDSQIQSSLFFIGLKNLMYEVDLDHSLSQWCAASW